MMDREQISNELKKLLIHVLKHERFEWHEALVASDVDGWDSLSHMTFITAIEDRFSFRFKLKELSQMKSVGSLIDLVYAKCAV